ncbi:hypothetical protein ACYJ1Y_06195 [Natrialbaceae archaeon A-gly3]
MATPGDDNDFRSALELTGMAVDPVGWLRTHVVGVTSLLVTAVWLVSLVTGTGGNLWITALIVGYIVVVPAAAILFGDEEAVAEWWNDEPRGG